MTNATNDCTGCPVSAGTHKPADAVHTEIAEPDANTNAQTAISPLAALIEAWAQTVELAHEDHVVAYAINRAATYNWKLPEGSSPQDSEPVSMERAVAASDVFDVKLRTALLAVFEAGQSAGAASQEAELNERAAELEATRDMLETARTDLELLREALAVPVEPHQSLSERMLEAAKAAGVPAAAPDAPWSDIKIAFDIPNDQDDAIWKACDAGVLIPPKGWELIETTTAGCAGMMAIFRVDHLPHSGETLAMSAAIAAQAGKGV